MAAMSSVRTVRYGYTRACQSEQETHGRPRNPNMRMGFVHCAEGASSGSGWHMRRRPCRACTIDVCS
jgi:hypothetical protein